PAAISARRTRCCQHHRKTMKAFASILIPILLALGRLHAAASAPAIETKNKSFFEFEVTSRNPFWPIGWVPTAQVTGRSAEHDAGGTDIQFTAFTFTSFTLDGGTRFAIFKARILVYGKYFCF